MLSLQSEMWPEGLDRSLGPTHERSMPTTKRTSGKRISVLSLPDDILVLVMKRLVSLHACPKSLLRFLLATKQLCKPRFKMFKTVVRPFMNKYLIKVLRARDRLIGKVERDLKKLEAHWDDNLLRLTKMLASKCQQLAKHAKLVKGAIPR